MVVGVHLPAERALGFYFDQTPSDVPLYSLHPNGSLWDPVVKRFVYSGVYRLDETQSPVPDLAEAPCVPSADLLLVTCRLREASFHDGTPVTADDVAFTYQLLSTEACRLPLCTYPDQNPLALATALDERTVEFRLARPDPAFITSWLAEVMIEPRQRVEAAFDEFVATADRGDPAVLREVAVRLEDALSPADGTECESPGENALLDAEMAIGEIGLGLTNREAYAVGPGGEFDGCAYGEYLIRVLTDAANALSLSGIDAIAAAYRILDYPLPVGSGPWRVLSIDPGVSMQLEAFDDFHRGRPLTARLEVRLIRSTAEAIEAVRTGAITWLLEPFTSGDNLIAEGIGDSTGVVWVEYVVLSWFGLHYNLRDSSLFQDGNLREAVELCVDKEETVAAATGGDGVAIHSPITPAMWAYEDVVPTTRDVPTSRRLIEASGWTLGDDGIYTMGERRLATTVPVWDGRRDLLRFLELLAFQVKDCGIELTPRPLSFDDLIATIEWPLVPPGADQQWDAVLAGWAISLDPDLSYLFHSRAMATASNPGGFNYMGYANPEGDVLLDQALATYDPPERARLYREYQRILAQDRPILFGYSPRVREARSDRIESTLGPLRSDTSTWWWQLETIVIRPAEP